MNITSINSFNSTAFQGNKPVKKVSKNIASKAPQGQYSPKYAKTAKQNAKHINLPKKLIAIIAAIGITTGGAIAIKNNNSKSQEQDTFETTPTIAIVETLATEETQPSEPVKVTPTYNMIEAKPISEREEEKYHIVKAGETLRGIVIKYADLDENYPYESLIPYFERLMYENPGKIRRDDRESASGKYQALPEYVLYKDVSLKVDGILPENIIKKQTPVFEEEPITEETQPTAPQQITSKEDTVRIGENVFYFDLGTKNKTILGDYSGLVFGKYVTLDKKSNGNVIETTYDGTDSKSNKVQSTTYDKDGKILEIADYKDNSISKTTTYTYGMNTITEKAVDKKAASNQIDTVLTVRDFNQNVQSRQFFDGKNLIASFDFANNQVTIGKETWELDENSFICNDNVIGADRYAAYFNNAPIRFDVVKNGFSVEYCNEYDEIVAREHFDAKGELIFEE